MLRMLYTILGVILLAVFGICAISNALIICIGPFLRWRTSMVPIVGGLTGSLGFLLFDHLASFWWLPPIIDFGTIPLFVWWLLARGLGQKSDKTLIPERACGTCRF